MNNRFGRRNNFSSYNSNNNYNEINNNPLNELTYIISKYNDNFDESPNNIYAYNNSHNNKNMNVNNYNMTTNINPINYNMNNKESNLNLCQANNNNSNNDMKVSCTANTNSNLFYDKIYTLDSSNSNKSNNSNFNQSSIFRLSELEESNLYGVLNVNEHDSIEKIKKSYKQLCIKHHPDKGGNPEKFQKISDAYRILSNRTYRMLYDEYGSRALEYLLTEMDFGNRSIDLDSNGDLDVEFLRTFLECKN